jgi:hypothetical protein
MRRLSGTLLLLAFFGLVLACKPQPGDTCSENAQSCSSPTSRLTCLGGKYALELCKGPKGCTASGSTVACDATRGEAGDACVYEKTSICSIDGKSLLRCDDGHLALVSHCAAESGDGCTVDGTGASHCPIPYADDGDPCKEGGACSADRTAELACKSGKMVKVHNCHGEEKCTPNPVSPVCDRSISDVGEPCNPDDADTAAACTAAGDTVLLCKKGKFVMGPRCLGANKCNVNRYAKDGRRHFESMCDQSIAAVGDECSTEGTMACSSDKKSRLHCDHGKFAVEKTCKKGCEIALDSPSDPFQCH